MLQVVMRGRLGNQMFRYATARKYMLENNINSLNLYFGNIYKQNFENNLKDFNIIEYNEIDKIKMNFKQKSILFVIRMLEKCIDFIYKENSSYKKNLFEKKLQAKLNKNGIYYLNQGYLEFEKSNSNIDAIILDGNFESAKYFDSIKSIIQEEFSPKKDKLQENLELYNKIENSNSICISIRRGDFLAKENKKAHYVCTPEYFEEAIKEISKLVNEPHFFVFSDDIEWVKHNMKFPGKVDYESGKDPVWEKLRLMYSCKHFIISNSTFSWWSQYLSTNKEKIVIAPSIWKNTYQNNDIYQENWILINPRKEE